MERPSQPILHQQDLGKRPEQLAEVHGVTDEPVDAVRHQGMVEANLERGRPVGFQIKVGAPEDEERENQQDQAADAQPDRQVIIGEIQPVSKRIDQRENQGNQRQQSQQDFFGAGDALPGFLAGFGGLLVGVTNHHLGDHAGPICELIEDCHDLT